MPAFLRLGVICLVVCLFYIQKTHADSVVSPLKSPLMLEKPIGAPYAYQQEFKCLDVPKPVTDLKFYSIYKKNSKNKSEIDTKAYEAYKKAVYSIRKFESGLIQMSNIYMQNSGEADIAECVISWLDQWSLAQAMLGEENEGGKMVRKWALSPVSLSYLQVRDHRSISVAQHQRIKIWIQTLAQHVIADFSIKTSAPSRRNNHAYWAAWAVINSAVILDDAEMFDWALNIVRKGIDDIQDDGTLPLELARGKKALHYHHFSAVPLFMCAHAAYQNGINLFDENNYALKRLGQLLFKNMQDQHSMTSLAGVEQDVSLTSMKSNLGWVEIYHRYFDEKQNKEWVDRYRPFYNTRAGGDVTLIFGKN